MNQVHQQGSMEVVLLVAFATAMELAYDNSAEAIQARANVPSEVMTGSILYRVMKEVKKRPPDENASISEQLKNLYAHYEQI